jgi:hypothetical protein
MSQTEKNKVRNFKATDSQMKKIVRNAKKFANGNLSAWLRHAASNYKPKKSEMVSL